MQNPKKPLHGLLRICLAVNSCLPPITARCFAAIPQLRIARQLGQAFSRPGSRFVRAILTPAFAAGIWVAQQAFCAPSAEPTRGVRAAAAQTVSENARESQKDDSSPAWLQRAEEALAAGHPHAVLHTLRQKVNDSGRLQPSQSRELLLLLQAEFLAGNSGEVLRLAEVFPEILKNPEARFWAARAQLAQGDAPRATQEFLSLAAENFPLRWQSALLAIEGLAGEGRFSLAEELLDRIPQDSGLESRVAAVRAVLLLRQGKPAEAEAVLRSVASPPAGTDNEIAFLLARALHEQGNDAAALDLLNQISEGGHFSSAAGLLRARCLMRVSRESDALKQLELFISGTHDNDDLSAAFELLEELLCNDPTLPITSLQKWTTDQNFTLRANLASLTLAAVEFSREKIAPAQEALDKVRNEELPAELRKKFSILTARISLQQQNPEKALGALQATRHDDPAVAFWYGCCLLLLGRHTEAAEAFAFALRDEAFRVPAAFNGRLAEELTGKAIQPEFLKILQEADPSGYLAAEASLQAALERARRGQPDVGSRLRELIPALSSAASAPLAEWLLVSGQPEDARQILEQADLAGGVAQQEERAYMEIFLADSENGDSDAARAAELCRIFLRIYPDSPRATEVRLKLGEIAFRTGDFLTAYETFSEVGENALDAQTSASAWYLAGKSAARLMVADSIDKALLAFEEAAQAGGEIAARARYEQALLFNARGDFDQAVVLLERVAADSTNPSLRASALLEKGDACFARGAQEPEMYAKAIQAWQTVANMTDLPASLRQQALTKTGLARLQTGQADAALEDFYRVVLAQENPVGGIWFERAGFEAGRLLEEKKAWAEAVKIYELLANAGGPRAAEAATRANRVRLENSIWEG